MTPLPSPSEVRDAFAVSGVFEPGSHRFVSSGIEVFGRLVSNGRAVPVGIQVGPDGPAVTWPWTGDGIALCIWSLRSPGLGDPSGWPGVDAAMRLMLANLAGVPWIRDAIARQPQPTRTWSFELPGRARVVDAELQDAVQGGNHIELYVQLHSNCVQRCMFCPASSPPFTAADQDSDLEFIAELADKVVIPARRNGVSASFRFDADDASSHIHLGRILGVVSDSCGCPMHLVIPANRMSHPAVAQAVSRLPGLMKLSTTIFGASPGTHDRVAGRSGAFVETVRAIRNLAGSPLCVQGHFVLSADACGEIGSVVDTLAHFGLDVMIMSLIADCEAHETVLRPIMPDVAAVRESFDASVNGILKAADLVNVAINDFPVCAVPPDLRHLVQMDHTRQTLFRYTLTERCAPCRHRESCIGVSPMYIYVHGVSGLTPED